MEITSRFKKDYFNYLISIIVPAAINAFSIPLFKHLLGPSGYGFFSITFNSILLCTALGTGWITQSVIRYFPTKMNKVLFTRQSLLLSFITQLIFFIPAIFILHNLKYDWFLSVLLAATLFITSMQFSMLSLSQSIFLSKKSIYSELIRTISFITIVLLLLLLSPVNFMYALFAGIFLSYFLSFNYLFAQTKKSLLLNVTSKDKPPPLVQLFKSFMLYGGPMSLYLVVNYLISLIDKYFMLHHLGSTVQGNYQAIFDFLSKSITIIVSPATISLFPILTAAYQTGKKEEIRKLLFTIIAFEVGGLLLAGILYWWFGADILFLLIKIPSGENYKLMGLLVIVGTFLWQIALIVHKPYELKFRSFFLLGMIAIAFLSQFIIYLMLADTYGKLLYPAGYLAAALIYLFLVSIRQLNFRRKNLKVVIDNTKPQG